MAHKKTILIIESLICILLVAVLSAGALRIYKEGTARRAADPSASIYTAEEIREKAAPAVPIALAGVLVAVTAAFLGVKDEEAEKPVRDLETDRELLRTRPPQPAANARLRALLLALALVFILAGVWNGSMRDVLIKAINICSECIGLG